MNKEIEKLKDIYANFEFGDDKYKTKQIVFRLTEADYNALKENANKMGIRVSTLMNKMVKLFLNRDKG